ncbi:MAG: DMT family transporter, partial [Acidobacteriota bacterium]
TFLFLLLLGLVPQAIGHTSYNWALRFLPATSVSTMIVGEPVLASLFAWWLLGERLDVHVIPGALLVMAGILLVSFGGVTVGDRDRSESRAARTER